MEIRKNLSLILGISIPIVMILLVAASIYIPALFIKPTYDFLYSAGEGYYNIGYYVVQNGLLTKQPQSAYGTGATSIVPKFYIHDVQKNESREISFEETQSLKLDSSPKSPDGFEVSYGGSGDAFPFFFSSGSYTHYLKGHNARKKLNLQLSETGYYQFRFLGWVTSYGN